jgi:hypothetical protein
MLDRNVDKVWNALEQFSSKMRAQILEKRKRQVKNQCEHILFDYVM